MRAYVLCGGLGTRLRPLIGLTQKAVADIDGVPFMELVVSQLVNAGVTEIVMCAGYRSDQLQDILPILGDKFDIYIQMVVESEPMGTGGALLNALGCFPVDDPYLVLNADTFVDDAAYRLISETQVNSILVSKVDDCSRYGSLKFNAENRVLELNEKANQGAGWVSAGVYRFSANALCHFPVVPCSLESDVLPSLVLSGELFACKYDGAFIDVGVPQSLLDFRLNYRVNGAA